MTDRRDGIIEEQSEVIDNLVSLQTRSLVDHYELLKVASAFEQEVASLNRVIVRLRARIESLSEPVGPLGDEW